MKQGEIVGIADKWLHDHYPDKKEPVDIRWSAVYNFAKFLDELANQLKKKLGRDE